MILKCDTLNCDNLVCNDSKNGWALVSKFSIHLILPTTPHDFPDGYLKLFLKYDSESSILAQDHMTLF